MRLDSRAHDDEAVESAQIRLESDAQALRLVTIHESKGLQYPVVICPFLWDGRLHRAQAVYDLFHTDDAAARLTVDLRSARGSTSYSLAERETFAENVRLLYVALTRARQLCLVVWGQFSSCGTSALGALLHPPPDPPANLCADLEDHIEALSDDAMRAELVRLAGDSRGAIEVADFPTAAPRAYARRVDDGPPPRVRRPERDIYQRWRMTSFSALTADERALPEPAAEGLDRDESAVESTGRADPLATSAVRGFPRGRHLGTLVHKIFETIDFTERDPAILRARTEALLLQYNVALQWGDAIAAAVGDVLDTPLPTDPPVRLRDVPAARRLNELEFIYPVALGGDDRRPDGLTAARLAGVLQRYGAPWLAQYAAQVRQLPIASISGFLRGYLDLVFEHGGRWYVVDYKTNDLGPHAADYRPAALLGDMQRHHYVLQYHFYVVAVHRYLQQRLGGYEYARHFGGALYLYVRGMAPGREPGCGVFCDRPAASLIRALSTALQFGHAGGEERQ
jgi:exodeoxyribonuclease V beta subunit